MPSSTFVLLPDAFAGLKARTLFYPSAGTDWTVPIDTFLPWIDDFWFVDTSYRLNDQIAQEHLLEEVSKEEVRGRTIRTGEPFCVSVRRERYRTPDDGIFTIHTCTGRGYDTLRSVFGATGRKLSVFFHRGDSPGEGGSNFRWLGRRRLRNVLAYLEPGGLIVTDGSLAIRALRRRFQADDPADIVSAATPFEAAGRRFICVGYLGERYGPTLVWKTSAQLDSVVSPAGMATQACP
jgi:hypothetical protein